MSKIRQIIMLFVVVWPSIGSAQLKIQLFDQDNKPVSQAVISIPTKIASATDGQKAVMDQINQQFVPHVLTINQGQFVLFPNRDNIRHHVYSFSGPKPFEIKLYKGTPTLPELFDKPGIVVLGCNVHDHMVGYIYVADNNLVAMTNENGVADFEAQVPDTVKIWHAQLAEGADKIITAPLVKKNDQGVWQLTMNLRPVIVKTPRKFKPRFN
ncbi:methylamine utilization protein [Nitrosomonas ureae]|uniref:Plastocyanin n=1 Tax=Nitrosomonas ureae TaxID=44577 RepID=A0A1H9F870_9PROT|nr:methylamine utilization protein [Nitrosomonas ureae]SEQ34156.1 hypothetical protein SAMN05421510_103931 [Nitrosomonas ureae]